ncbi:hypothetical protein OH76DRAFT_1489508 [Lentinus brumalis]|uniref:Uncharacterized protein n=1 Tax=Lentinus brumalis TaxID=2498619 RepID=A0A371CMB3_9APHY|nr:hypothetical protein OH76DRAFT_1489508 [Polyporus brumalis]
MYPATPSAVMTAAMMFFPDSSVVRYDTLDFTIAGVGVRCRLPIADGGTCAVAILDCQDRERRVVALLLHRRMEDDGRLPRYHVGASFVQGVTPLSGSAPPSILTPRSIQAYRLLPVDSSTPTVITELNSQLPPRLATTSSSLTTCQIKEFYVMHFPPRSAHPRIGLYADKPQEFFVPTWVDVEPRRYGFRLGGGLSSPLLLDHAVYTLSFSHTSRGEVFTIVLGRCKIHLFATVSIEHYRDIRAVRRDHLDAERVLGITHPGSRRRNTGSSKLDFAKHSAPDGAAGAQLRSPAVGHDCPEDHIHFWDNASRLFGDEDRRIQLTFSRWPDPESYCLDIRLCGRIYETFLETQ